MIDFTPHTNGDLDGGATNVLYNRDNKPAPVWKCKPGQAPPPAPPAPFLTDDNATDDVVRLGKRSGIAKADPIGVAGAVFGGIAPPTACLAKPRKKKNLVKANIEAAKRVVPIADRPKVVSRTISRRASSRQGDRDKGTTARPLPHTGRGMWQGQLNGEAGDGR